MATQAAYQRLGCWAGVLDPDKDVDRNNARRVVPMEVLSLGASRTGTFSMQEALEILGYPDPYHFVQVCTNVKDVDVWNEAFEHKLRGKGPPNYKRQFDAVMGHCGACTDVPASIFWRELVDVYPDAKIVLVERDEDRWYKSMMGLVENALNPAGVYFLRFADPSRFGRINTAALWWIEGFFGTTNMQEIRNVARQRYRQHYSDIRAAVPKERLLEFDLSGGWEPLCTFLGKPIPDVPFPHRNEAEALNAGFDVIIQRALEQAAVNIAMVVGIGAVLGGTFWRLVL